MTYDKEYYDLNKEKISLYHKEYRKRDYVQEKISKSSEGFLKQSREETKAFHKDVQTKEDIEFIKTKLIDTDTLYNTVIKKIPVDVNEGRKNPSIVMKLCSSISHKGQDNERITYYKRFYNSKTHNYRNINISENEYAELLSKGVEVIEDGFYL